MTRPQDSTISETNLKTALQAAVDMDGLDDACRTIQDLLGVDDGGLAGVMFSELDDDPSSHENSWKGLSKSERRARLVSYIKSEIELMAAP